MTRTAVAFSFLVALLHVAAATTFSECHDGSPVPSNLVVAGCEAQPCDVVKGTTLEANVTFTPDSASTSLHALATAYVSGLGVSYPLPEPNACNALVLGECPVEAGNEYIYRLLFPLEDIFPSISVSVELSIIDSEQAPVTCFRLDISVKDP